MIALSVKSVVDGEKNVSFLENTKFLKIDWKITKNQSHIKKVQNVVFEKI
jgi:hypothetical protein